MSFLLTDEQNEFQSTLRKYFADAFPLETVREAFESRSQTRNKNWGGFAELGLFSSFGSSSDGGFDLGPRELAIVAFECGYSLLPEPLSEHILFGPYLFSQLLKTDIRSNVFGTFDSKVLSELFAGTRCATFAPPSSCDLKVSDRTVSGELRLVPGLRNSDIVISITRGSSDKIIAIKLDQNNQKKIEVALDRTISYGSLTLKDSPCIHLEGTDCAFVKNLISTLKATELVGAATKAVEITKEYVKTRKQFGVSIGGFQAVQHKLVDMYLMTESARALAQFASWAAAHSPDQFGLASQSALAFACEKLPVAIEQAIQLHGGIGFTWEYELQLYLRRARSIEALYRFSDQDYASLISAVV